MPIEANRTTDGHRQTHPLAIHVRWWLSPLAALIFLTGLLGAVSACLPASIYDAWGTPKYLDGQTSLLLLAGLCLTSTGVLLGQYRASAEPRRTVVLDDAQVAWLETAYRITFWLAIFGYLMWIGIALANGVGLSDLGAVVQRQSRAIGSLKGSSRPVAGLTTWTQMAPIAVSLGVVLGKLARPRKGLWVLFGLAAFRTLFYAERLALLEVVVPAIVLTALLTGPGTRGYRRIQLAPFLGPPAVWALFSGAEYVRSWVHYQQFTDQPFIEWVTLRMLGYYTTAFNNSALLYTYLPRDAPPYFSVDFFWNAPGVGLLFHEPLIGNSAADVWWNQLLTAGANPEFTNQGSFLVVFAEFGPAVATALLVLFGLAYGRIYRRVIEGSVVALVAHGSLFIGILELPRFNYLSLGRVTPTILGLLVIAATFPRAEIRYPGGVGTLSIRQNT